MGYGVEKSVQSMRDIEEAFVYVAEGNLARQCIFWCPIPRVCGPGVAAGAQAVQSSAAAVGDTPEREATV